MSDAFHECAKVMIRLHVLLLDGEDGYDSPAAEDLRGSMDPLWWLMTPKEQERIGQLSEDLYRVTGT